MENNLYLQFKLRHRDKNLSNGQGDISQAGEAKLDPATIYRFNLAADYGKCSIILAVMCG